MTKWDYSVVSVVDQEPFLSEALWEKGDDGWELVTAVYDDESFVLFFKKPADPQIEEKTMNKDRHIPAPLSDCLRILLAHHHDNLSPAERKELEESAALLELYWPAMIELLARIEACGASLELTHAVTLAGELLHATGNRWNPRDKLAEQRVRDALKGKQA